MFHHRNRLTLSSSMYAGEPDFSSAADAFIWTQEQRNINDDVSLSFPVSSCAGSHLNALPGLTGTLFWLLTFVFSNAAAAVQILHEPEEGQLVEEDL